MGAVIIKTNAVGTIGAIRSVRIDEATTRFAMVIPEDGWPLLAVRIGLNITAEGDDYFFVGDKVRYTVLMDPAGEFPRALDLEKCYVERNRV
ncbi:hypothetical protein NTD84_19335 [Pseudomonas sp. 14P_8.1_Bac3]|uniref:hypothetical protein n=1 Tax=Pseudomonas sp. 14P_8.1_Bac3 TaxID=2971621 RepID=UPI0021C8ADD5|nr:hypothetical protein [Pseudomonas sp. 14P_8.1_Bac3]MCU1761861.1 hypothetical protein [Pseudomonas sp. 14P_8.1_Bac3]